MRSILVMCAAFVLLVGCKNEPEQKQEAPSTRPAGRMGTTGPSSEEPATQPAATQGAATQASESLKPINKYCAVDRDDPVDPKITYEYQGKIIGFCCEDCIPKFKKDPEKYMKDLK